MLLGHPRLFRLRLAPGPRIGEAPALFDLEPLLARLPEFVDFDRLNNGEHRIALVATDVETGAQVAFDTARGTRLGPHHVVASSALMPIFAPVELEEWLLADGGMASNAPLDLFLDAPRERPLECILFKLFARAGSRPRSLGASLARTADLGFGNQTERMLEGRVREYRLRALVGRLAARLPEPLRAGAEVAALLAEAGGDPPLTLVWISYRAAWDGVGPGKLFDFSAATLADGWAPGAAAGPRSAAIPRGRDHLGRGLAAA